MTGTMLRKDKDDNRDWWIPWSFVALFLVVLLANGIMLFFAVQSWTGVGTADAYKKGLAYNLRIDEAEEQAQRGWQAAFGLEPAGALAGRLVFVLKDRHEATIDGATVVVELIRPTHEGHDFSIGLRPEGGGRYTGRVDFPLPGLWEARLSAEHRRGSYRLRSRLNVQP